MKKKILIAGTLFFIFSASMNAFASEENDNVSMDKGEMVLTIDSANGKCGESLSSLFEDVQLFENSESPSLNNIEFFVSDGRLVFNATLRYSGEDVVLNTSGVLYKNKKTERSGVSDTLILAEMDDTQNFHFAQFRFDKISSALLIVLQDIETKELFSFSIPLSEEELEKIDNIEDSPISGSELDEKIVSLYSISHNLIDAETKTDVYQWQSPEYTPGSFKSPRASYNGWKELLTDLEDGTAKLGDHPNVNADFFKGNEWQYDNAWNLPYTVTAYSYVNGPEYLTQFSLIDVTAQDYPVTSNKYFLALQFKVNDGVIVSYNPNTDILTLLYSDLGISFNNVKVGIGKLTNNAFFIDRTVSRRYVEEGNLVRAFVSLYPPADDILNVLEGLSWGTNQPATEVEYFESTYNNQMSRYEGKLVRGIVASSEENRLVLSDHLINVGGNLSYDPLSSFSWYWAYSYSCATDL